MADSKITALTALTAADPVNDMFPVVDVSDTFMAASGTTKRISVNNILSSSPTASGALTVTGLVTAGSATITGDLTVDTSTLKVNSSSNTVGIGTASSILNGVLSVSQQVSSGVGSTTLTLDHYHAANKFIQFGYYGASIGSIGQSSGTFLEIDSPIIAFKISGSEAMRLNSTGLGVGTASPSQLLSVKSTANAFISIDAGLTNQAGVVFLRSGSYDGAIYYLNTERALRFDANNGERLRINSTGNLVLTGGTAAATGVGVTFPATQVASSDANCLDDYEEGTWTPVVADASTGGNVGTCVIQHATYTKIGRQVSIECYISSINTTGMTGANFFRIRGLPFATVKGGNGNFYSYRVGRNASTVSSSAFASDASSSISFPVFTVSSATTDLAILVSDVTSGISEFIVSVTYSV